ncbi:hypothetical protein FB45DRAFT_379172 [Roridomyces roridus]|uniref:F-box domain-containing protein n=1 Tax=Roridomyces roridus TaxID=1738132 RepID=A0AAD7B3A2_9AGAR|nr:hypothetical protein FB45DRAFT_379172 [Roridomyces roridus]
MPPQQGLSRFKHSNDAPSGLEAQQVRQIRDEAQRKLTLIEARLEEELEGHSSIEILERTEAGLQKTLQLCDSILSPIRHLPPEILAHIFLFSLPPVKEAEERVEWYEALDHSPWVLGRVSRRWRAVALNSPALWTSIIIQADGDSEEACCLPMLEAQLERSGKSPLDIIFMCEEDPYLAEEALKKLIQHSARWKPLVITARNISSLPRRIRKKLPLLQTLCVRGYDSEAEEYDGESPPPDYLDHFGVAPRLRSLEVEFPPRFKVPWGQLTRYEASGGWDDHISVLVKLKRLESCKLDMAHEAELSDPFTWGSKTIQLTRLRRLELSCERYNSGDCWSCPAWLRLPALTGLSIQGPMFRGLAPLLQNSNCTLKKLHITGGAPEKDLALPVFESSAHIAELEISLLDRYPAENILPLLTLLSIEPDKPVLLPRLRNLIIVNSQKNQYPIGKMLVSRWNTSTRDSSVARLRSLRFVNGEWAGPLSTVLSALFDKLRSKGVDVRIGWDR